MRGNSNSRVSETVQNKGFCKVGNGEATKGFSEDGEGTEVSSLFLSSFPLSLSLFSFGWLVVISGGIDPWMWEWQDEHGLEEEEDFHIDGRIMHNRISFMTGGLFALTRDGAEIYFWCFDFRLHYTLRLGEEKEMLWRFCCGMEPTSMKKT